VTLQHALFFICTPKRLGLPWHAFQASAHVLQALGLLVEVQGRRFAHRAPAVLRLVLGVLRGHEAAAEAEDVEELRAEQLLGSGGDANGGADRDGVGGASVQEARDHIATARGWQEAYAALVLFEKIGHQVRAPASGADPPVRLLRLRCMSVRISGAHLRCASAVHMPCEMRLHCVRLPSASSAVHACLCARNTCSVSLMPSPCGARSTPARCLRQQCQCRTGHQAAHRQA